jgi:flagellar hook protein FlgE
MSVYDTLGVAHTLTTYYVRTGAGAWTVNATMDGGASQLLGNLTFNTSGALTSGPTYAAPSFALTTGAVTPWSPGTIDFTGSTQYGTDSGVDKLTQGGYTAGSLSGMSVGNDGVILGRYSNGQSRNLGQVVLAKFSAPTGLVNLGANQWAETSVSGPALVGAPGSSGLGVMNSSSIEESNVDLTAQLVSMITNQRNYQASAQTIKTQDQVMQTLVNLR